MFTNKEYDFSLIQTSSKEALKRSALVVSGNDIKKATEIYEFFVKDIQLPDTEPVPPTMFDQLGELSNSLSQFGEKYPNFTNGIATVLMNVLKNSKFGAFLQPAAEVITETPEAIV